jgi:parvulin-like peptidyl-prolyl isomerase
MRRHSLIASLILGLVVLPAAAQDASQPAATVNGQPITEAAVQRGLKRLPPEKHAAARSEILQFLIDNMVVDQYLAQLYPNAPQDEVEKRLEQVRKDISKEGQSFEKVMEELMITPEELRTQVAAEMRWERYAGEQMTEKVVRNYFENNKEMFDGTTVRARHILLECPATDNAAVEQNRQKLLTIKSQIQEEAQKKLAGLPASADNLTKERVFAKAMEDAFADQARKNSACPSKEQGGDLGWFPRSGTMVEPFARVAFTLKPHEMSDVVVTQFGQHLILATDRKATKDIKFEEVKDVVTEVYRDKLRESLCAQLKPRAQITLTAAK